MHTQFKNTKLAHFQYYFPTTALDPNDPDDGGFNPVQKASIYVTSTLPISIVASSYSSDGSSGDRFLVLPTTLLRTNYVVGGKNHATGGTLIARHVAYVIATSDNTDLTYTLLGSTPEANQNKTETSINAGAVWKFVSPNRYTFVLNASKPVAVIVGANCFMYRNGACDHQAQMLLPVPPSCSNPGTDLHLFNNINGNISDYYVASTFGCDFLFEYDTNLGISGTTGRITPNDPWLLTDFTFSGQNLAPNHFVLSSVNPVLITQFGTNTNGTYLVYAPPTDQFVTGTVLFAAFDGNSQMQVIGDTVTENSGATLDGQPFPGTWTRFPGVNRYYLSIIGLQQGPHSFSSNGLFMITVFGTSQSSAYAYLPGVNAPVYGNIMSNFFNLVVVTAASCFRLKYLFSVQQQTTTASISSSATVAQSSVSTVTTSMSPTSYATSAPISSSTSVPTSASTLMPTTTAASLACSTSSGGSPTPSASVATEGVQFWTIFIPNKGGNQNSVASLTFFNRNQQDVTVNLTYYNTSDFSEVSTPVSLTVASASMCTVSATPFHFLTC